MKLVTFLSDGQERIGAVMAGGRILDFHGPTRAWRWTC